MRNARVNTQVLAALKSDNTWNRDLEVSVPIIIDKPVDAVIFATANGGYIAGFPDSRVIDSEYINISKKHDLVSIYNTPDDDKVQINLEDNQFNSSWLEFLSI